MDIEAELHQGIACQKEGRLGDAVRHYQRVLAEDPGNVDALNLMSVLALAAGDPGNAAGLAQTAIARQPDWFMGYINLGNAIQALGRPLEAAAAFQRACQLNPQSPEALINLSGALNEAGRPQEAADIAVQAILMAPRQADAHVNFGNALLELGSPGEAEEAYRKATTLAPENALAWYNLGHALLELGELDEAIDAYMRSIAHVDAGIKHVSLGNALVKAGRLGEAVAAFALAIELEPGLVDGYLNKAALERDLGLLDAATATLEAGLAVAPGEAELHWNRALVHLTRGEFGPGWAEYEWRWRTPHFAPHLRQFPGLPWEGQDLEGKTILVHYEQGFGDAIQMARLLPELAERAARVVVECRKGLGRLLGTVDSRLEVIELGAAALPVCDYHVALMSLPHRLGLTLDHLPVRTAYLSAPPGAGDFSDLGALPGLRVGVVWSGAASRADNASRSFDPHLLAGIDGCSLVSLQKGEAAATASDLFDHGRMVDAGPRLDDFADTAAAIAQLDMVVAIDTAVAHLAGAMGKPVLILLAEPCPAFLWMQELDFSPWYPTAKLIRQDMQGDWSWPLALVRQELSGLAAPRP
jgi:tetratricopeptide (TPR) repeat protein